MEYELIMCLIPAVVPFKLRICTRAIDLAQCIKCPRLKIPFCSGFIQVFYSVAVSWPAQRSSGAISSKWEIFPVLPASPSFPLLGARALWCRAWKGSALHRACGVGVAFGSHVTAADGGTYPVECFHLHCVLVGGMERNWLGAMNSTSQRKVGFCAALRPEPCMWVC